MNNRPLFKKKILELELMFDQFSKDPDFLKMLIVELSGRKTNKAQQLKQRAVQAIETISKAPTSTILGSNNEFNNGASIQFASINACENERVRIDPSPEVKANFKGTSPKMPVSSIINNKPEDILFAWTAMEVLSPPTFRKPTDLTGGALSRIASINKGSLPWENGGEKGRPNYKLYYQIILGSIDMQATVSKLLQVYADSRVDRHQSQGEAILGTIMVDSEGYPVKNDAIAISSFGWGVPIALAGDLRKLDQWSSVEKKLLECLEKKIFIKDVDGHLCPLTLSAIMHAYDWLAQSLGIDTKLLKKPTFAVRSYQYYKLQDAPESILLNSFFLDDLAQARRVLGENKETSENLNRYLGSIVPNTRYNLMKDNKALLEALEPKKFPLGSWPGKGRYPLVMLQQCAVNLAIHDLTTEGILAVNGPPGTGKTTLLRDVIASIITKRAEILCSYEDPEHAFIHSGEKHKKGNAFLHIYKLDDKIRGHEIIVTSSNNKAVENVSAELPGIDTIATDVNVRYFKTVSDSLLKRDTWGLIAAVLGNNKNKSDFRQNFWWDKEYGFQCYLQHTSGNNQFITEQTENGTLQRTPCIILQEDAPHDHNEALRRWKEARLIFKTTLKKTDDALKDLQSAYNLQQNIQKKKQSIAALDTTAIALQPALAEAEKIFELANLSYEEKYNVIKLYEKELEMLIHIKPTFWKQIFQRKHYTFWKQKHHLMLNQLEKEQAHLTDLKSEAAIKNAEYTYLYSQHEELKTSKANMLDSLQKEKENYKTLTLMYPSTFINDDFFELSHQEKQKTVPWLDKKTARLRNDVFEAAMTVHKAFIDAAAKPVRHNLNILLDGFGIRSLGSNEKDLLIPQLWSTLFLVVPVISSTFASISRMFGKIGSEKFGWLLIDEAGQALPQAAVGALMRTKRAVVVGDPMQIEPVVVLPEQLTEAICHKFGIDPLIYNSPQASVQTLADSATEYYGTFETKFGTREVGVPLLVHRRCADPMFSISNAIAYENMMVQEKTSIMSSIRNTLGQSHWINVESRGEEKWCPEEGNVILHLLHQLRNNKCMPDLYIVTPFVIVQDRMRDLLHTSGLLEGWIENPYAWVYERIGTVHTVQGREAEAVFFILGAPELGQSGARGWAGNRPNLLNVAISRAKEVFYVIGNRHLWKNSGVFQSLDFLEVRSRK